MLQHLLTTESVKDKPAAMSRSSLVHASLALPHGFPPWQDERYAAPAFLHVHLFVVQLPLQEHSTPGSLEGNGLLKTRAASRSDTRGASTHPSTATVRSPLNPSTTVLNETAKCTRTSQKQTLHVSDSHFQ